MRPITLMEKKYSNYDECLQEAYEQQADRYAAIINNNVKKK